MFKQLFVGVIVGCFSFSLYAQNIEGVNGRLDGMGGSGASDDIGWTIYHPATIASYANKVQGTICTTPIPGQGETFGAIIGIMQLSNSLYGGFTLNDRMNMPLSFYAEAYQFMAPPHLKFDEAMKNMLNLPSLNFCYKMDDQLSLGLGAFFEEASESSEGKMISSYTSDSGKETKVNYTRDYKSSTRCDGAILEAKAALGGITVVPLIKIGFPRIGGSFDRIQNAALKNSLVSTPSSAPLTSIDSSILFSSKGSYLKGGFNAWGERGKTLLIGGLWATRRSWQFSKDINTDSLFIPTSGKDTMISRNSTFSYPSHAKTAVEVWFALVPYFSDGLYISPEYNGGIEFAKNKGPESTNPDTTQYFIYNNFRLGIEKISKDVWIFNELGLRCGIVAYWNKEIRIIKNTETVDDQLSENMPWKSFFWGADFSERQAKVCFGFTLKKGRGTLDVSCNMKSWKGMGTLSGPPPALATLTVDFGKNP